MFFVSRDGFLGSSSGLSMGLQCCCSICLYRVEVLLQQ